MASLISHRTAIDYELCGRGDANHIFRDFRSATQVRRRDRTDREKYYHYRGVNRGQLSQAHHRCEPLQHNPKGCPSLGMRSFRLDCEVAPMSKAELYQEAQRWPRPPTHHRSRRRFDDACSMMPYIRDKTERRHHRPWLMKRLEEEAEMSRSLDLGSLERIRFALATEIKSYQQSLDKHSELHSDCEPDKCFVPCDAWDFHGCPAYALDIPRATKHICDGMQSHQPQVLGCEDEEFPELASLKDDMVSSHAYEDLENMLFTTSNVDLDDSTWVDVQAESDSSEWEVISVSSG